jgi:hypothetical protein
VNSLAKEDKKTDSLTQISVLDSTLYYTQPPPKRAMAVLPSNLSDLRKRRQAYGTMLKTVPSP